MKRKQALNVRTIHPCNLCANVMSNWKRKLTAKKSQNKKKQKRKRLQMNVKQCVGALCITLWVRFVLNIRVILLLCNICLYIQRHHLLLLLSLFVVSNIKYRCSAFETILNRFEQRSTTCALPVAQTNTTSDRKKHANFWTLNTSKIDCFILHHQLLFEKWHGRHDTFSSIWFSVIFSVLTQNDMFSITMTQRICLIVIHAANCIWKVLDWKKYREKSASMEHMNEFCIWKHAN